jgi:hypothetical protein
LLWFAHNAKKAWVGIVMQTKQRAERAPSAVEQREFQRNAVNLSGNLIVPAEDITMPCQVLDLSGGGASIRCEDPPPLHTYVILWIGGFGRLEAVTKRFVDGELSLEFVLKETKRQRLLNDLHNYAQSGMAGKPSLRRHARLPSISKVRITLPGGDELSCEVINVSTRGLSLRTGARPPVDHLVSIGGKYARVVRHHGEGVAVEFSEHAGRQIP